MSNLPNDNIPNELLKSLQITTQLMNNLLDNIKDHSTSLAIIKEKVQALGDNVDSLAHIVRDGNGNSMITRLALMEKEQMDLKEALLELKNQSIVAARETKKYLERDKTQDIRGIEEEKKYQRERSIARWKFWGILIAAGSALFLQLYQQFIK